MDTSPVAAPADKALWQSKTFWVSVVTALAPGIPGVAPFIAANPWAVLAALGVVFTGLRKVTHGKVTIL